MKQLFSFVKLLFQFLRCVHCAHRNDCNQSMFVVYRGITYAVTLEKVENDKKDGE